MGLPRFDFIRCSMASRALAYLCLLWVIRNQIDISNEVTDYVEKRSKTLPEGISIQSWGNSTAYLSESIGMMVSNMLMGIILVLVTLGIFLVFNWLSGSCSVCLSLSRAICIAAIARWLIKLAQSVRFHSSAWDCCG